MDMMASSDDSYASDGSECYDQFQSNCAYQQPMQSNMMMGSCAQPRMKSQMNDQLSAGLFKASRKQVMSKKSMF